ncbi:cytochrome c-type biogenesis protein CcmH [Bacillus sp. SM2101]|uniref:cytochrome c-type biogenesis protein CcmH n=1 Tax=Bacillus sp. SM2101 TaxID=2805366 RepID=UPI0020327685|nr:cytochrome c-type biogenesis protein CcmH [Bacillus sp. SM2101]
MYLKGLGRKDGEMMKRLFILTGLLILLFSSGTYAVEDVDYSSAQFQSIVAMLAMEGHAGDDLATCPVKQEYYEEVAQMMQEGMNKEEILNFYVEEIGEEALSAPLKQGFSLSAWITPFIVLIVAGVIVFTVIRSWIKKNNSAHSITTDEALRDENTDSVLREMIDKERKKLF